MNSLCLFIPSHLVHLLELNSKGLYQSSRKEIGSCCLVSPSSTKVKLGTFSFMAEKFTKKPDAHAKLFFFQSNPIAFLLLLCNNSNGGLKDICIGHNDDSFCGEY